jgi:hypothetical protein
MSASRRFKGFLVITQCAVSGVYINVYEVIVERQTVNRLLVKARTQHEAAMAVGIVLGGDQPSVQSQARRKPPPESVAGMAQRALDV